MLHLACLRVIVSISSTVSDTVIALESSFQGGIGRTKAELPQSGASPFLLVVLSFSWSAPYLMVGRPLRVVAK